MPDQPLTSSPPISPKPFRSLVFAGLLSSAWVALWWLSAASAERLPRPFVFWDVALVSVLCGVPVGLVIADMLLNVSRLLGVLLSAVGLAVSSLLFLDLPDLASFGIPWLGRWFWGGLVGISSAVLAGSVSLSDGSSKSPNWPVWSLGILVPLMSIASFTYAADRARYHEKTVQKYLSQSRSLEARNLILKLQALDPSRRINGRPLAETAAGLNQEIKALRAEVSSLQAELAKADMQDLRIRLAEDFAMLGETNEAIGVVRPLVDTDRPSPAALNLLGTIFEHQERWSESLGYYEQARDGLLAESASSERRAELVRAWKGIAYAHRNQSRHREAEAAYQKVLQLEPSAENHYLMAQFYENAQQGDKAQHHAYLAAELDPAFREKADQLVNDLQGNQFGCWGVFQNRRNLLSR